MNLQSLVSHVGFLIEKSVGIWFAIWALRHRAGWDYKLNGTARAVRWSVVGVGYSLAASLPGPAVVRLVPGFLGIGFLCWPNFAYRLAKLFAEWPVTEGRVVAIAKTESGADVMYDFQCEGKRVGGTTSVKQRSPLAELSAGQAITVRYDPLNLGESEPVL
jgi:hypothetical protein